MNRNLYRIVFNAARGVRMAVQETARSVGKATSGSTGAVVSVAAIAGALMSAPLHAQIVADPSAPGSQRPTVLVAPNGVPLVNVQTPSAAGVSRNVYRQFDVNSNGVILNNSRTNVATQLGGYVQGNPWLASGSARIIVNEINSSNPSYLHGFIEVAGSRSEVVIANPAGIQVDGGGFINVSRATLTTGTPQYGASGSLESYVVRGGTVGISGAGLNASSTDSLSILSRAFELSGALHATDLTVVAGANQVTADLSGIAPIAGTGNAPSYAIDVAQLGGMYANHIAIIVNEQGVGARNTGTIQTATGSYTLAGAGKLTLSADGLLENSGLIQTSSDATIRATGLANNGTVQSGASLAVSTQSDLANHIGSTGGTLEGQRVELSSAAGSIDNRAGTIRQTSTAALTVTAPSLTNTNAGFIGTEPVTSSGSSGSGSPLSGSGSSGSTGSTSGTTAGGSTSTGGTSATTTAPASVSPGSLTAAAGILNDGGKIYAGGDIALQTPNVNNDGGTLNVASMALSGPSFSNAGGRLNVSNTFTANVGTLNNAGGSLHAGTMDITTTGDIDNQGGTLASDGDMTLAVGGAVDNSGGTVSAVGTLSVDVAGVLDNTSGKLLGNAAVDVAAGSLNNTQGSVQSAGGSASLNIAHQLLNDKGSIGAGTDLSIQAGSLANTGTLRAERDGHVTVTDALSNAGSILSGSNTTVSAGSLSSGSNGVVGAGIKADGTLGSAGDLTITTTGSLQAAGTVLAAGDMALQGASTDLSGSKTSGANIALTATTGDVTTSHATVTTPGTLSVSANTSSSQFLVNDAGDLNAGQLELHASNIQNTNAGRIVQTGTGSTAIAVTGVLDNTAGTIASNGQDLTLAAATLRNAGGLVQHAGNGTLAIDVTTFSGANGSMVSNGALNVQAVTFNQDGGSSSAKQIRMDATDLSNVGGSIVQTGTGTTHIAATSSLVNDGGTIASNGVDLNVSAGALSNVNGHLQHAGTGTLNLAANSYGGTGGEIVTNGRMAAVVTNAFNQDGGITSAKQITIDAGSLSNVGGSITQTGSAATRISTATQLVNDGGTIASNATDAELAAGGTLSNMGGYLQHAGSGNLAVTAARYDGANGELVSNGALVVDVAGSFRQDGGATSARQVTIDVGSLSNVAGTLIQTGTATTHIATAGDLNNSGGTIASNATDLELAAGRTLSNADGHVQHAGIGAFHLAAGAYSATAGQIASNGELRVQAGSFNQDGGTTSAKRLTIDAAELSNRAGSIVQTGAGITHIAATSSLVNDGGTIASNGVDLNVSAGALSNANGHLQHAGAGTLNLVANSYDGAGGEILTNGGLVGNAVVAFNQDGGTTTAKNIALEAGSLSNRGGKIVQTGTNSGSVTVSGLLDNGAGAIASNGNLSVTARSLANQGGSVRSAGTASLEVTTSDLLDNSHSGVIGAGRDLTLHAGRLSNDAGAVTAVGDLSATISGAASNVGGTLAANGNTTVAASRLDNTQGTVAAVTGDLSVTTTGTTTNTQGTLQAAGRTSLVNAALDNMQGKATGNALTVNANGGALNNTLGTLAATATVDLQSGVLTNDRGLVQSGGAMTVNTHGQALVNTNAAGHASGQGGIASGDTLGLTTGAIDNTAGFIGAKDVVTAAVGGFTNAAGGILLGQADVTIGTNGATYDNRGGKTLAVGNLGIDVGGGTLQNSGALLRSGGTATVSAGAVDNTSTLGTDQGIEGQNVAITAATLNNDGGAIRADTNATITSAGRVSNVNGLMSARDTLALLDPNRASPTAKTLSVVNTGGTLTAGNSLQLDAATFSADGTLTSGQDLSIALTQNLVNNATVSANRNLTYATTGTLTNNGQLLAGNVLTVSGRDVENTANGEMRGDTTIVNASNTLTNRGLIDGHDTQINAGTLNNIGTGRIYGDHLSIAAGTLNNLAETVNGTTQAGSIAARDQLDIGAGIINNRDGALIFSAGDMHIGGALDENRQATGQASRIDNSSATIESLGNMRLSSATINNIDAHLSVTRETVSSTQVNQILPLGWTTPQPASNFISPDGKWIWLKAHPALYGQRQTAAPASVTTVNCSGGVDSVCDAPITVTEPRDSPRFAQFGVTPPIQEAPRYQDFNCGSNPFTPCAAYDAALAAWNDNYTTALTQLDAAITAYNAQVNEDNRVQQIAREWTELNYTETISRDVATGSDPARIVSGGSMDIHGQLINRDSQVIAGGTIAADQTPQNIQSQGTQVVARSGQAIRRYWEHHGGLNAGTKWFAVPTAYTPADEVTTYPLSAMRYEQGTQASSGNAPAAAVTVSVTSSAGSTGSVNSSNRNGVVLEVASALGGTPGVTGDAASVANGGNGSGVTGNSATAASSPVANSATGAPVGASTGAAGPTQTSTSASQRLVVRTTTPDTTVPKASLFQTVPGSTSHYLVETDPAFADYRTWLSSDYLLAAMGYDPATVTKRLGDGFYEQRLIREQVAQLTGYRYLEGMHDDQSQYTALMDAGMTFANEYHLTPGIALSAAQMAQLTSDIVWLVEQTVTLADGSTQRVLVPQVYVRVRPGDIDGSGALLSAEALTIKNEAGQGDLVNGGTIAGRTMVSLTADNIQNLGGRIAGGSVGLNARNDLNNIGGTIEAQNAAVLKAGNDINIVSTTQTQVGTQGSRTNLDRVAGVYVTNPGGTLVASAGHDVNLVGAILSNAGAGGVTSVKAGNDINLGTVKTSSSQDTTWDAKNYLRTSESAEVGSTISTNGTTVLNAGNDISIRQGTVDAGSGLLSVHAERNIDIEAGSASQSLDAASYTKSRGFLSSRSTTTRHTLDETLSQGSSLSGGLVSVTANNNIAIEGSALSGTDGVLVHAGNVLSISEARDSRSESNSVSVKRSGLAGSIAGIPVPIGAGNRDATTSYSNTAVASTITSQHGGVLLQGDGAALLQGVKVDAAKDITITGGVVSIAAATDYTASSSEHYTRGTNIGTSLWHDPGKGIDAKNTDTTQQQSSTLDRTELNGANVRITATGADGKGGLLAIAGTTVNTPGTLTLSADRLILGTQTTQTDISQTSQGGDVAWIKSSGNGSSDQTTNYNQFNAGTLATPVNSVQVGLGAKDSIDALAQQPGMAWINQIANDPSLTGNVDWTKVEEAHRTWDYDHQGLTPAAAAVVTLVVAYFTAGAASGIGAAAGEAAAVGAGEGVALGAGAGVFTTAAGATISSVVAGAVTAGISALAGQAAVAVINNRGDIGGALDDLGSSASVRSLVTAIITGGVLGGLNLNPTGLPTEGTGAQRFIAQLGQNLQAGVARALIATAINGGSLEDSLGEAIKTALINTAAAQTADFIGRQFPVGELSNYVAHSVAGCLAAAARASGGCAAGAIGAVVGEAAAIAYNGDINVLVDGLRPDTVEFAAMMGGIASAIAGQDPNVGAQAAGNAAANNLASAVARGAAICLEITACRNATLTVGMAVAILAEVERTRAANPGMSERAVNALAVSSVLAQATVRAGTALFNWFTSTPAPVVNPGAGGYGAGGTPNVPNNTGNTAPPPDYGSHTGGRQPVDPYSDDYVLGGYGEGGTPAYEGSTTTPNNGPLGGTVVMSEGWTTENESMSQRARDYQTQITGVSGQVYVVNGVKFDGVASDGTLLDAKGPGYGNFVGSNGEFVDWFGGADTLVDQAQRQIRAAGGTPVRWIVAEQSAAAAIQSLLNRRGVRGVTVTFIPPN